MEMMLLVSALLRGFSSLALGPEWGAKGAAISQLFGLAATTIDRGGDGAEALKQLVADVEAMVAAGRDPTPEEWAGLKTRSDRAHAELQKVPPSAE